MSLLWSSGGRLSISRSFMVLARRSMWSVGSLSGLDPRASVGQWLNCVRMRRPPEGDGVGHLSPFRVFVHSVDEVFDSYSSGSILSLIDGRPKPISFGDH